VRRTEKPPTELIDEFQRIVKDAKLQDILGLYHIEWTEGRKNLTREITDDDKTGEPIQTAWDFGRGDPETVTVGVSWECEELSGGSISSIKSRVGLQV
jgi:hypothetical protein